VKGWLAGAALMMAVPAAADDGADIRAERAAYNAAILARDVVAIRRVFGPGYKGIAGSGGELIDGGDAMAAYFANVFRNPAFVTFTRTPDVIRVGEGRERAMERGGWLGRSLTPDGGELQLSGEYLAVWVPMDARWVLRSESFVTLERREVPVLPLP
jgi:ketosteroid isomerase-like protein